MREAQREAPSPLAGEGEGATRSATEAPSPLAGEGGGEGELHAYSMAYKTPSMFVSTSLFQKRMTRKLCCSRNPVLAASSVHLAAC